jgi:GH25 family lysozyme M1 (1,4-beta-N-acetylmuramidase)
VIRGLDASAVQGALPFDKLDPALRFVILKAQEGNASLDPCFERNMRAGLAAGLRVFAYCFAYPIQNRGPMTSGYVYGRAPKEQARLCVDCVHAFPEMRGRPIFLDLEWPAPERWATWGLTAESISKWCDTFCAEVALLSGTPPIIYTYPWWWQCLSAADVSWAARYGLWLAAYVKDWPEETDRPRVPRPWDTWLFWQFDGDGGLKLPTGVDADFCVFNGTEDELQALTLLDTPPTMRAANDVDDPVRIDGGTVTQIPLPEIPEREPDDAA